VTFCIFTRQETGLFGSTGRNPASSLSIDPFETETFEDSFFLFLTFSLCVESVEVEGFSLEIVIELIVLGRLYHEMNQGLGRFLENISFWNGTIISNPTYYRDPFYVLLGMDSIRCFNGTLCGSLPGSVQSLLLIYESPRVPLFPGDHPYFTLFHNSIRQRT